MQVEQVAELPDFTTYYDATLFSPVAIGTAATILAFVIAIVVAVLLTMKNRREESR